MVNSNSACSFYVLLFRPVVTNQNRLFFLLQAKDVTQWHHWGNSSYKFINTSTLTWEEAANACKVVMGEGAHLVFIESELEDKEVSRMVNIISEPNQRWWIGLTDKDSEGKQSL
ncbi:hypothetical protein HOLleu_14404 [Holothuria leucospilota]|uniref:C-type lectin domain-containing protein n=1 Tax=Holothuria leucospilota TaxID=206669 RepID=A0A9Q1C866_HOLLE|nr:hypothetical protein HOLleu_14404 [Holothuria leucospilota]